MDSPVLPRKPGESGRNYLDRHRESEDRRRELELKNRQPKTIHEWESAQPRKLPGEDNPEFLARFHEWQDQKPKPVETSSPHLKPPAPQRRKSKSKSQLCAEDVAKIHGELHKLSRAIQAGKEDYELFRKENPKFLTFKAVRGLSRLREQIVSLPDRQRRFIGLAQTLAGILHERKPSTVKSDWKHWKPAPFKRSR